MRYVKVVLLVILAVFFFFIFFSQVNVAEAINFIKKINPVYVVIFLVGCFIQLVIRGYRWGILLKPYKQNISLTTLYHFSVIGFFLNIPGGRLGEPLRAILIAQKEKIRRGSALATVVIERLIDFLFMAIIFLFSLIFIDLSHSNFFLRVKSLSIYLVIIVLIVFVLFLMLNLGLFNY